MASAILGVLLFMLAILGVITGVVLLLVFVFSKSKKRPAVVVILSSFAAAVLGLVLIIFGATLDSNATSAKDVPGNDIGQTKEPITNTTTPAPTPEPTPEPAALESEYRAACQEVTYKELMRKPEDNYGRKVKVVVEIRQTLTKSYFADEKYYFGYTDNDGDGWYFDDRFCLIDKRVNADINILEDDVIAVYGEFVGGEEFETLLGIEKDIPVIEVKYIDLIEE